MATSKKVFLASDVIYAFIDRGHPKHEQAAAFFRFFSEQEYQIYTDMPMLIDVYNQISHEISPSLAKDFIRVTSLSNLNLLYPDDSDMKAATKALLTYPSNDLSFSQALMAVEANRRSIPQICTFSYLHSLFGLTLFYLPI